MILNIVYIVVNKQIKLKSFDKVVNIIKAKWLWKFEKPITYKTIFFLFLLNFFFESVLEMHYNP